MDKIAYYIEGDGIGPEIWAAARPVMDAAMDPQDKIIWRELLAGEKALRETGENLPEATLDALKGASHAIKGPLATPVGGGIRSLNVALRQILDLYACIRPVRHIPGLSTPVTHPDKVDMIIFRENTEDVYAGLEFAANTPEARKLSDFLHDELGITFDTSASALGIKPMSERKSKRLIRKAIQHALERNLPSVTLVHKGNIMKFTEGAFRKWGYEVAAEEFPGQTCTEDNAERGKLLIKDRIADAMFQDALLKPQEYSVLATPNLNGDYLSDALAAQTGGLGLAPGVNMSDTLAFFEATHGTAPNIAGKDMANPGSLLLSGAMMLEHMGHKKAAERIRKAIASVIAKKTVTPDLAPQIENAKIIGCKAFGEEVGANL